MPSYVVVCSNFCCLLQQTVITADCSKSWVSMTDLPVSRLYLWDPLTQLERERLISRKAWNIVVEMILFRLFVFFCTRVPLATGNWDACLTLLLFLHSTHDFTHSTPTSKYHSREDRRISTGSIVGCTSTVIPTVKVGEAQRTSFYLWAFVMQTGFCSCLRQNHFNLDSSHGV